MYDFLIISSQHMIIIGVFVFIFGLLIGSFMEVVRTRGSWRKALSGRSICINCNKNLYWYELIPFFSYIILKGRCGYCKLKIPSLIFFSEVCMGVLFLLSFIFADSYLTFLVFIGSSIFLLPIVIQDIEDFEVPEHLSISFTIFSFLLAFYIFYSTGNIFPFVYGVSLAAPFFFIWFFSGGKAMGLGDAKVALPMGFLLMSFMDVIFVFFGTFWIGLILIIIFSIYAWLAKKRNILKLGNCIPLVPSMAIAYFIILFANESYCSVFSTLCLSF